MKIPEQESEADQALPRGKEWNGDIGVHGAEAQRLDRSRRQILRGTQAGEELQCAEPKEDDAQTDAQKWKSVASHRARDARVQDVEAIGDVSHLRVDGLEQILAITSRIGWFARVLDFYDVPPRIWLAAIEVGEAVDLCELTAGGQ